VPTSHPATAHEHPVTSRAMMPLNTISLSTRGRWHPSG
jgi:hypothetical protein